MMQVLNAQSVQWDVHIKHSLAEGLIRMIWDYGTQSFCTLTESLVKSWRPTTLANARKPMVRLYLRQRVQLHGDISTQRVIHSLTRLF